MNARFMQQIYLNGTGRSMQYGILQYNRKGGLCCSEYPRGAPVYNTFEEVSDVHGACQTPLIGGVSVATYPSPNYHTEYSCGDGILLITQSDTNVSVKSADDYCPACKGIFQGTQGHIDDYSSSPGCTGASVGDFWDYWTANTHGEKQ